MVSLQLPCMAKTKLLRFDTAVLTHETKNTPENVLYNAVESAKNEKNNVFNTVIKGEDNIGQGKTTVFGMTLKQIMKIQSEL